jgi:hypothetical protein
MPIETTSAPPALSNVSAFFGKMDMGQGLFVDAEARRVLVEMAAAKLGLSADALSIQMGGKQMRMQSSPNRSSNLPRPASATPISYVKAH